MRVLHVVAGNLYGGVETFIATLARYRDRVPELDSEFALCFDGRLATELRGASAIVHGLGNVRLRDPISVLHANRNFFTLLQAKHYDAVIAHGAWPHALVGISAKLKGCQLVTWGHGAPLERSLLDRIAHLIRPDLLIVNSRHTAAALGPQFAGVPTRLIYYPVEMRVSGSRSRADIRRELDTADGSVVIAFAARFERWKGHDLLLRAARALLDRTPSDWCIWMCGGIQRPSEKAYAAELERYAQSAGLASRVRFLGERSDVPDLLSAADVFCQPNTGPEPFGIVFIEALYAGLPVVSTNMGGAAEIVDESCGLLAEPAPQAVAEALYRLVADAALRQTLAEHAPQRARLLCDPEPRIREIAAAIQG